MRQPIPIFEGDIVDSKLKLTKWMKESLNRWILTFKTGTHVDIIIRKHKSKRTNEQNRYYWGVVIPILGNYFGYDKEEMHEELKRKFNPIESKIDKGVMIGGSTTKLSTEEFYSGEDSYVERICRWFATEYGGYVPPPERAEEA